MSGKSHRTGKRTELARLAAKAGIEPPAAAGGTVPRSWIEALARVVVPEMESDGLAKAALLRELVLRLGGKWQDDYVSAVGSTITGTAIAYLADLVGSRIGSVSATETSVTSEARSEQDLQFLRNLVDADNDDTFWKLASAVLDQGEDDIRELAASELIRLLSEAKQIDWPRGAETPIRREAVIALASSLDERVPLLLSIQKSIGRADQLAGFRQVLERVYEDERFVGSAAPDSLADLVFGIMERCDDEVGPDDLDEFVEDGSVKLFCLEMIQAHLEDHVDDSEMPTRSSESSANGSVEDESEEEDEEDISHDPVRAQVKTFTVRVLFDYVQSNELDLQPPWQRKDVWSRKKKRELIKSLLLGIPLPSIILHKNEKSISIIDGKQRLTSIVQFMRNEFKLPNFDAPPEHPLHACRGAWFRKEGKKSLPPDIRRSLELRDIPALLFEEVSQPRLRQIFHLYNVSGTRLNAAEIRNAVYQSNPIHQAMYVLAGEQHAPDDLGTGDFAAQLGFTEELRAVLPSVKRYAAVDFLCRYLGYSRAAMSDPSKPFRACTTSTAINRYFDYVSQDDKPIEAVNEIMEAFEGAQDFFFIDGDRLPFYRRNEKGQRKFNSLIAISNMIAARFLQDAIADSAISREDAISAAEAVHLEYPDNQQSSTIWDYQARLVLGLREHLGLKEEVHFQRRDWEPFLRKMQHALIPEELVA